VGSENKFGIIIIESIFAFKSDKMARKYTVVQVALLATAFKKSIPTIYRWINKNDDRLTSDKAKKALSKKKSA